MKKENSKTRYIALLCSFIIVFSVVLTGCGSVKKITQKKSAGSSDEIQIGQGNDILEGPTQIVVGDDGQLVLLFQQSGDVRPEGGEATVVVGNLGAVQADLGAVAHTLELQPDLLGSGVKSGGRKAGFIGAAAAPVVVAAILAVDVVPGMGQVDRDGFAIRAGELPVFHQRGRASHSVPP